MTIKGHWLPKEEDQEKDILLADKIEAPGLRFVQTEVFDGWHDDKNNFEMFRLFGRFEQLYRQILHISST